jgi:hypothetical protein
MQLKIRNADLLRGSNMDAGMPQGCEQQQATLCSILALLLADLLLHLTCSPTLPSV